VRQLRVNQTGTPIPADGYVLSGYGKAASFILENLTPGSRVKVEYKVTLGDKTLLVEGREEKKIPPGEKLAAAVGGQALLVEGGSVPERFTQEINGRWARTAVGISKDGKMLYLVAVEKSEASIGMNQRELAEYLVSQKIWRAVNLDGGGSTTLAVRKLGEETPSLVNRAQAGSQRKVPNALGVFTTAPRGRLKGIVVEGPSLMLAGTKASYTAKGYDEYYNPYPISLEGVRFSALRQGRSGSSLDQYKSFEDNVFEPKQDGRFKITARYKGVKGFTEVEVLGRESMAELEVAPSFIQTRPGQVIPFAVRVKTKDGRSFPLAPGDVHWTVSGKIGEVKGEKFIAAGDVGTGFLEASFYGLHATVPVEIRTGNAAAVRLVPEKQAQLQLGKGLNVYFPAGIVEKTTEVKLMRTDGIVKLPGEMESLGALTVSFAEEKDILKKNIPGDKQEAARNGVLASDAATSTGVSLERKLAKPWRLEWGFEDMPAGGQVKLLRWDRSKLAWEEQPFWVENTVLYAKTDKTGLFIAVADRRPLSTFKDTAGHWSEKQVLEMAGRGIIQGYPGGKFGPEDGVTRAQFVAMLGRALKWEAPRDAASACFVDEIPDWADEYIAAALARGVINGYPDGTFRAGEKVTRAEMAAIVDRVISPAGTGGALKEPANGNVVESPGRDSIGYKDLNQVPEWARQAVLRASAAGILQGYNGCYRPADGTSRAEAAVVIYRVLHKWVKK